MSRRRKRAPHIDSKEFIEAYMKSDFNWQVAEKLGVSTNAVASKAVLLRAKGVNLPRRYARDDVAELNEIIEEIEKELSHDPRNT